MLCLLIRRWMHHRFVWRKEQTRKCFSITTLIEVVCITLYQVCGQLNPSHSYEVSVAFPTNPPDGSEPAVGSKLNSMSSSVWRFTTWPLLPKFWVSKISFQRAKKMNIFYFYFNTENYAGFYIVVIILHIFFCINFFCIQHYRKIILLCSYSLQNHHL